jgi:hypothetical protein
LDPAYNFVKCARFVSADPVSIMQVCRAIDADADSHTLGLEDLAEAGVD